jgi:hypothetical protein
VDRIGGDVSPAFIGASDPQKARTALDRGWSCQPLSGYMGKLGQREGPGHLPTKKRGVCIAGAKNHHR